MAKFIAGTVTGLRGSHKGHWRSMWDDTVSWAKTSLWAQVTDSVGTTHDVWVGKIPGRCGVPVKRQEEELVTQANFLLGQQVVFEQKRNGFLMLFGVTEGTMETFVAELKTYLNTKP